MFFNASNRSVRKLWVGKVTIELISNWFWFIAWIDNDLIACETKYFMQVCETCWKMCLFFDEYVKITDLIEAKNTQNVIFHTTCYLFSDAFDLLAENRQILTVQNHTFSIEICIVSVMCSFSFCVCVCLCVNRFVIQLFSETMVKWWI